MSLGTSLPSMLLTSAWVTWDKEPGLPVQHNLKSKIECVHRLISQLSKTGNFTACVTTRVKQHLDRSYSAFAVSSMYWPTCFPIPFQSRWKQGVRRPCLMGWWVLWKRSLRMVFKYSPVDFRCRKGCQLVHFHWCCFLFGCCFSATDLADFMTTTPSNLPTKCSGNHLEYLDWNFSKLLLS